MTFQDIPLGSDVFLDANVFIYDYESNPVYGATCTQLLRDIELKKVSGFTTAAVLSEVTHRIMTIEAVQLFGWPTQGIANRLRRHRVEVQQLADY